MGSKSVQETLLTCQTYTLDEVQDILESAIGRLHYSE
jgi:hypothetical protein